MCYSVVMDIQRCTACFKDKESWHFRADNGKQLRNCEACRVAARGARRRQRGDQNPDFTRANNLWQKYRIRPPEYDARRAAQDYRCAICRTHENEISPAGTGRPRLDGKPTAESFRLVVDHCHDSGKVRGLLCSGCNRALGYFRDSPTALRAAADYLEG